MALLMKGLNALNSSSLAPKLLTEIDKWVNIEKLIFYEEMDMDHIQVCIQHWLKWVFQLETMQSMSDFELSIFDGGLFQCPLPFSLFSYFNRRYSVLCTECGGRNNYIPTNPEDKQYQCVVCKRYSRSLDDPRVQSTSNAQESKKNWLLSFFNSYEWKLVFSFSFVWCTIDLINISRE